MFESFGLVNFSPCTKVAEFARHLEEGRLMASRCGACGTTSFPPRADCVACMGAEFEYVPLTGEATLHTYSRVCAAPTGFEEFVPYTVGVVDLAEGGRLLAWIGETVPPGEIKIGMPLQVVPRVSRKPGASGEPGKVGTPGELAPPRESGKPGELRVYYTLETPGTISEMGGA